MSAAARDWAWAQDVPTPARFVLVTLADYVNEDWGYACPSMATLGRRCGMTAKQARRHVARLERRGLVTVERVRRKGGWLSNRYILPVPAAGVLPPEGVGTPTNGSTYSHPGEKGTPMDGSQTVIEPVSEPVEEPLAPLAPLEALAAFDENDLAPLEDDGADDELAAVSAAVLLARRPRGEPRELGEADFEALRRERQAQAAAYLAQRERNGGGA